MHEYPEGHSHSNPANQGPFQIDAQELGTGLDYEGAFDSPGTAVTVDTSLGSVDAVTMKAGGSTVAVIVPSGTIANATAGVSGRSANHDVGPHQGLHVEGDPTYVSSVRNVRDTVSKAHLNIKVMIGLLENAPFLYRVTNFDHAVAEDEGWDAKFTPLKGGGIDEPPRMKGGTIYYDPGYVSKGKTKEQNFVHELSHALDNFFGIDRPHTNRCPNEVQAIQWENLLYSVDPTSRVLKNPSSR